MLLFCWGEGLLLFFEGGFVWVCLFVWGGVCFFVFCFWVFLRFLRGNKNNKLNAGDKRLSGGKY